jgi:hypothetical protein
LGGSSNAYLLERVVGGYFNLITYLLNLITMKELKPTTVVVFIIFSLSSPLFLQLV